MDLFYQMDADGSGALNFGECKTLLDKLKVTMDEEEALELFKVRI